MKNWDLKNKKAVVTGGSKGIGKAIVAELAALGADVLFTGRDETGLSNVEQELKDLEGNIFAIASDITNQGAREKIAVWVGENWGKVDILVNNAGINIRKPTNEYSSEEFLKIMDTNLLAPFELCRSLFPFLAKSGSASIINIASVAGTFDVQSGSPYGIGKAGLIQLSRNLASEWAVHDIRVNSVSPWYTQTPLTKGLLSNPEKLNKIVSRTPLKRIGRDEEIAAAVAFLAMDKASYITGHNLSVDGGVTSGLL